MISILSGVWFLVTGLRLRALLLQTFTASATGADSGTVTGIEENKAGSSHMSESSTTQEPTLLNK